MMQVRNTAADWPIPNGLSGDWGIERACLKLQLNIAKWIFIVCFLSVWAFTKIEINLDKTIHVNVAYEK